MIFIKNTTYEGKALFTVMLNKSVLDHMQAESGDYLNFFQSSHMLSYLTLFKADTGYRITRTLNKKNMYKIDVRKPLNGFKEFECASCTYYMKKNGFIKIILKPQIEINI